MRWGNLVIDTPADGPARLRGTGQPLVEILIAGEGRDHVSRRFSETSIGRRLRITEVTPDVITQRDERTGLIARLTLRRTDGGVQARTTVTNDGAEPILLLGVTSLVVGLPANPDDLDLLTGDSEWLGEGRWTRRPLRDVVPDLHLRAHGQDGRGCHSVISSGTWSTGTHLPGGALIGSDTEIHWQIEHNGPWRFEVGERRDGVYLALLGPTDVDHQWRQWLAPGESFTTVPVSVASSIEGLTAHRRALRRSAPDHTIIFNDYMNTLMGDPTTAKLLPLIDAAAAAGAEVFCVDAGWYDNGTDWWDSVGEWQPSQTRFPSGLEEVIGRIRGHGMIAGLWLEPEVIGVRSPMADKLPLEAFLQRGGVRVVEHGRYHLDLRHPAAVAHLDEVVDRVVEQFGVGYFKLDYNIDPGVGTDLDAESPGAGLLGHNRAHLAWLVGVLDRHPGLILENCASGGMRADQALLQRTHLQSTSDQQDFRIYPPIAVAAPLSMLPEQAASWAYPQPEMSDEEIAFTMCTGMLGRLYLSGRLDAMSVSQAALVRDGVDAYREIRSVLPRSVPVWPLGLPGWDDGWLSLGLRVGGTTYLGVWRRPGASFEVDLPLPDIADVEVLYPRTLPGWAYSWENGSLSVSTDSSYSARIFRLTSHF
ncbi:alpha-galactosidase [Actinoplanes lutulentus]|uniref:Alpha-galactosidase n=1 Tax=Actinoplanes lutulentus TaxID=1287878 RepID=A0A327Z447_9ACTN|nr:alpha-galactosidase [Actinoplanes lutulentus]MBB2948317.1 alpha-galactosidase [Actinoplanes lutulentus]RAK30349.1 alpha-galactosidase [Actinoplanes lutulentus]